LRISSGASGSRAEVARSSTTTAARELAPRHPALGDECALRRGEPVERLEPFELTGDGDAHAAEPRGLREQERFARELDVGDRLGKLLLAALHRLHGRAQREPLERLGQRGLPNLRVPEQRMHSPPVLLRKHDQTADGSVSDARPYELETVAELPGQLVAERLDDLHVVRVEHERDRVQPEGAKLTVVEVGELGDEREQPAERLEVAGKDKSLVTQRGQPAAQLVDLDRDAAQLGAQCAGIQRPANRVLRRRADRPRAGRDQREQAVRPRGEATQLLAPQRTILVAAEPVGSERGARVGDLDQAEPVELSDDALDLAPATEEPHLGHGDEHVLRLLWKQQRGELGDQLVTSGGRLLVKLLRVGLALGTERARIGLGLREHFSPAAAPRFQPGSASVGEQLLGLRARGVQSRPGRVVRAGSFSECGLEPPDGIQRAGGRSSVARGHRRPPSRRSLERIRRSRTRSSISRCSRTSAMRARSASSRGTTMCSSAFIRRVVRAISSASRRTESSSTASSSSLSSTASKRSATSSSRALVAARL
jgi:hypothetical protein